MLVLMGAYTSLGLYAQSHGLTLGAGYSLNTFQTENMNKLVNSFNNYYQVGLKKPFSVYDLASMQGFNINVGYRYMKRETVDFRPTVDICLVTATTLTPLKFGTIPVMIWKWRLNAMTFCLKVDTKSKERYLCMGI